MKNKIDELLLENRKQDSYFYSNIPFRFSDYMYNGEIQLSKCFDIFEMARFQFLDGFQQYLNCKENNNILFGQMLFCVIKVEYNKHVPLIMNQDVRVKSYLMVDRIPILTFRQQLTAREDGVIYNEANIKIALVDESMHAVKQWRDEDLINILNYIQDKTEKE